MQNFVGRCTIIVSDIAVVEGSSMLNHPFHNRMGDCYSGLDARFKGGLVRAYKILDALYGIFRLSIGL